MIKWHSILQNDDINYIEVQFEHRHQRKQWGKNINISKQMDYGQPQPKSNPTHT